MSENVTPADRIACALHEGFTPDCATYDEYVAGRHDDTVGVQAFAMHRARERQAIVDWLRAEHHRIRAFQSAMGNCEDLADAIERGEHLEAPSHE